MTDKKTAPAEWGLWQRDSDKYCEKYVDVLIKYLDDNFRVDEAEDSLDRDHSQLFREARKHARLSCASMTLEFADTTEVECSIDESDAYHDALALWIPAARRAFEIWVHSDEGLAHYGY
jgi:hypothetical protein